MSKKPKKNGDYTVGKCKPPKATQFKPCTSGNPKGRPKGAKNLKTLVENEASAKIVVKEGDQEKAMSKAEAIIRTVFHKALSGKEGAQKQVIALLQSYYAEEPEAEPTLSADDWAVLNDHAAFVKAVEEAKGADAAVDESEAEDADDDTIEDDESEEDDPDET